MCTFFFFCKEFESENYSITQYHFLFHLRPERKWMHHKSGCQTDNQNYTFLFGWLWWSALSLNYAAWINLSWRMSGKVEWWYLISTDATQWEHQTGSEWVRWRLCNCWGRWLARLSPRLVSAVSNMLNQWKASLPLYAIVLSEFFISLTAF